MAQENVILKQIGHRKLFITESHRLPYYLKVTPYYDSALPRLSRSLHSLDGHLTCVDIGANIGDSVALITDQIDGNFLCIEGDKQFISILKKNIPRLKPSKVTIEPSYCISANQSSFNYQPLSEGGTTHLQNVSFDSNQIKNLKTLDQIIATHPSFKKANLLKIDTDGFELNTLNGAHHFLKTSHPAIFFEFTPMLYTLQNQKPFEIFTLLQNFGYHKGLFYDNIGFPKAILEFNQKKEIQDLINQIDDKHIYYYDILTFPESSKTATSIMLQELLGFGQTAKIITQRLISEKQVAITQTEALNQHLIDLELKYQKDSQANTQTLIQEIDHLQSEKQNLASQLQFYQAQYTHFTHTRYYHLRTKLFYLLQAYQLLPTLIRYVLNQPKSASFQAINLIKNKAQNPQIKILYDFQTFAAQRVGGISRIFDELIKSYCHSENTQVQLALGIKPDNLYLEQANYINPINHQPSSKDKINFTLLSQNPITKKILKLLSLSKPHNPSVEGQMYYTNYAIHEPIALAAIKQWDYDVFHPTYFDTYFISDLKKPFVLTIYDLIPERFPQYSPPTDVITRNKKLLAQNATRIIAISENTKKDIISLLKIPARKIDIIPLAASLHKSLANKQGLIKLPEKYLLFVGTRANYKNFNYFLEAISPLMNKDSNLHLVCVGDKPACGPFTSTELTLFKNFKLKSQIHFLTASDAQLAYLYTKALAFVFPSLYEGFGIPILEAFACDCPVVCSNTSSLPEVAGKAAIYFDPTSKISIHKSINKVIHLKSNERQAIIKRGLNQLKQFSWQKTADLTLITYRKALQVSKN